MYTDGLIEQPGEDIGSRHVPARPRAGRRPRAITGRPVRQRARQPGSPPARRHRPAARPHHNPADARPPLMPAGRQIRIAAGQPWMVLSTWPGPARYALPYWRVRLASARAHLPWPSGALDRYLSPALRRPRSARQLSTPPATGVAAVAPSRAARAGCAVPPRRGRRADRRHGVACSAPPIAPARVPSGPGCACGRRWDGAGGR